jgi:hypothetical protein
MNEKIKFKMGKTLIICLVFIGVMLVITGANHIVYYNREIKFKGLSYSITSWMENKKLNDENRILERMMIGYKFPGCLLRWSEKSLVKNEEIYNLGIRAVEKDDEKCRMRDLENDKTFEERLNTVNIK